MRLIKTWYLLCHLPGPVYIQHMQYLVVANLRLRRENSRNSLNSRSQTSAKSRRGRMVRLTPPAVCVIGC
ncbi:hypothetical protein DPMN_063776 [Dreissena polymorpha]|uniref:Uncharacterized protein n=1 Tax=Dreissena polymorpha TaxID=45954 RepID=A0A9D4CB57_DREPO|nr:hypothetical protein DPMN_063776 [Dreissena polymorpha]